MEYCTLSFIDTEDCRFELDESDLMMMDEFQKIFNFYKVEKTFYVQDDWLFMDIFNIFASRYVDLEATILAEKELEVASIVNVENMNKIKSTRTADVDEVMEDVAKSLHEYTYSTAEFFVLGMPSQKSKRHIK